MALCSTNTVVARRNWNFVCQSNSLIFNVIDSFECSTGGTSEVIVCTIDRLPWEDVKFVEEWCIQYVVYSSDGRISTGTGWNTNKSPNYPQFCFEVLPDTHYTIAVDFFVNDSRVADYTEVSMIAPGPTATVYSPVEQDDEEVDSLEAALDNLYSVCDELDAEQQGEITVVVDSETGRRLYFTDLYLSNHGDCIPIPSLTSADLDDDLDKYAMEREIVRGRSSSTAASQHSDLNPHAPEFIPLSTQQQTDVQDFDSETYLFWAQRWENLYDADYYDTYRPQANL